MYVHPTPPAVGANLPTSHPPLACVAGLMAVWAWAEHRILDALEQVVPEVDMSRVGVVGCSRYGKTALAAAIFDERVSGSPCVVWRCLRSLN